MAVSFTSCPPSTTVCRSRSMTSEPNLIVAGFGFGALRSPHQGADPRHELVGAEWLGEVVIGADVEPDDAIGLFSPCRHHDDRDGSRRRIGAKRTAHFQPAHARQHDVEDHEIERLLARAGECLVARGDGVSRPAGSFDVVSNEIRDVAVVFGDEDVHGSSMLTELGRAKVTKT